MEKVKISIWLESPDGDKMEKIYIEEIDANDDIDIAHEVQAMIPDLVFWDWERIEEPELLADTIVRDKY